MQFLTPELPCVPTELVAFRKHIGEAGAELILKESIRTNRTKDDDNFGNTITQDSTVQEKNITYPADDKNYKKHKNRAKEARKAGNRALETKVQTEQKFEMYLR